jgi:hypothetical protein
MKFRVLTSLALGTLVACNPDNRDYDSDGFAAVDDCNDRDDGVGEKIKFYRDADGDGFGVTDGPKEACVAPEGYAAASGDCDDTEPTANPNAIEVCDGLDNNCVGGKDEAGSIGERLWYTDTDGDGYGTGAGSLACAAPANTAPFAGDCDDTTAAAAPNVSEQCDEIDNNCDGSVDEADAVDAPAWYGDVDGDGHAGMALRITACTAPSGWFATADDCDDTRADVKPGGVEICGTGVDEDCDGNAKECTQLGTIHVEEAANWLFGHDGEQLGVAVAVADLNGDGTPDVLTGAPAACARGEVDIAWGPLAARFDMAGADTVINGSCSDSGGLGTAVSNLGDVNGDGYDDIAILATSDWMIDLSRTRAAEDAVFIFYGPIANGHIDATEADVIVWTNTRIAHLGAAGDLDDDGYADLVLGAPDDAAVYGFTRLADAGEYDLGDADVTIAGVPSFGYAATLLGDVNGDGHDDLLATAPETDERTSGGGAGYLMYGPIVEGTYTASRIADATIAGTQTNLWLGYSAFPVGDIDGDGDADFAIGAPGEDTNGDEAGAVYVFGSGLTGARTQADAIATIIGVEGNDWVGAQMGAAGDFDGDGKSDLAVTNSHWRSDNDGYASLFYGPLTGVHDIDTGDVIIRDGHAIGLGNSITMADTNGDGVADMLLGAPYDIDSDGSVFILRGLGI